MPLPSIKSKHPTYLVEVPSSGRKVLFRPCLVSEEKVLLTAKASDDPADFFRAAKHLVEACCLDDAYDLTKLTTFDVEFLFIRIRAMSVNNVAKQAWVDNGDGKTREFDVDLMGVQVEFPEGCRDFVVKVTDTDGVRMRWPLAALFEDGEYLRSGEDALFELVLRCVESVYDKDRVYTDFDRAELEEYLDGISVVAWRSIVQFMNSCPRLKYEIRWTNDAGVERVQRLRTLTDFFTS